MVQYAHRHVIDTVVALVQPVSIFKKGERARVAGRSSAVTGQPYEITYLNDRAQ